MKLTIQKCEAMQDWYTIERAEHDGRQWLENIGPNAMALRDSSRFSDADVEGYASEMLAIADAIERKSDVEFRRCAVDATKDPVKFWSPRNSQTDGACSYAEAADLAAQIRALLGPAPPADLKPGDVVTFPTARELLDEVDKQITESLSYRNANTGCAELRHLSAAVASLAEAVRTVDERLTKAGIP